MRTTWVVFVVSALAAPAAAVEYSRAELVVHRGVRLVEAEHATERLRLNLSSGEYRIRSGTVEGRGQARAQALRLSDLFALRDGPEWPERFNPRRAGPREDWRYILRVYRAGSSKPARVLRGELSSASLRTRLEPQPFEAALDSLLRLRREALAALAPKLKAAERARVARLPKALFGDRAGVLLTRVEYEAEGPGEELVDAVQVFADGRVQLRSGRTQADLARTYRFRLPAARCAPLAAALRAARRSVPRATRGSTRRTIYSGPTLSKVVVFDVDRGASWQVVDRELEKLLADLPLRGYFGPVGMKTLHPRRVQRGGLAVLRRFHRTPAHLPGPWPEVGGARLDLSAISEAEIKALLAVPEPVPVLFEGRWELPVGQEQRGDQSLVLVVTRMREIPRRLTGVVLEVRGDGTLGFAPGEGAAAHTTIRPPESLKHLIGVQGAGARLQADGWLRTYGPKEAEFTIEALSGRAARLLTKTHELDYGKRKGYGADLKRGAAVRVTGALERGERLYLEIGRTGATQRFVNAASIELTPAPSSSKAEAKRGLGGHLQAAGE